MASYDLRFLWSHPTSYILQAVRRLSFCHIRDRSRFSANANRTWGLGKGFRGGLKPRQRIRKKRPIKKFVIFCKLY